MALSGGGGDGIVTNSLFYYVGVLHSRITVKRVCVHKNSRGFCHLVFTGTFMPSETPDGVHASVNFRMSWVMHCLIQQRAIEGYRVSIKSPSRV